MRRMTWMALAAASCVLSAPAMAQAPAAPPLQVPNPSYVAIPMEITVNKPVAEVWARVGKYCDIAEWFQMREGCKIISGKDGEVGAVRNVENEVLVGKTQYSYTYTQPAREGQPYNLYHGTLEARPIDAKTTRLLYTLMYDVSLVPGDAAAKQKDVENYRGWFTDALKNMKVLAEGGKLASR